LLASSAGSSANSAPASAPSGEGRRTWRPALGSKPAASTKARVRESRRSRSSGQVVLLTKVTATVLAAWPRGRKTGCIAESSLIVSCYHGGRRRRRRRGLGRQR